MPQVELYGSAHCPYTQELREWLEWNRRDYCEYNVDADPDAYARLRAMTDGATEVPVLVEDGRVIQVGWQGRSCLLSVVGTGGKVTIEQAAEQSASTEAGPRSREHGITGP